MTEPEYEINPHFMNLVMMLQMSAMQSMGKIASPISGEVERNLDYCRVSIDMMDMLVEKTKGNLNKDEKQYLDSTLYNLRMNFLEETEKAEKEKTETGEKEGKTPENREESDTSDQEKSKKDQNRTENSD